MPENDSLKIYMDSCGQYPRLTTKQEAQLAAEIAKGDDASYQHLVNCNLRLVVKIAHDFKGRGLSLEDLIAEGNIGLMRAARKFDPAKGAKFSSYSAYWIKQAIGRAIAAAGHTVRIPQQTARRVAVLRQANHDLTEELGRKPTQQELSRKTGFSIRTVKSLLGVPENVEISLMATLPDGERTYSEVLADTSTTTSSQLLSDQEDVVLLGQYLQRLTPREKTILSMRFGLDGTTPKTLEQVADGLKCTRERIRQIQILAVEKLRAFFEGNADENQCVSQGA